MPDPISINVSAIPGEQIVVTVGQIVQSIISFNRDIYNNASPAEKTKLADSIIEQNLRAMAMWERVLDFLKIPKVGT